MLRTHLQPILNFLFANSTERKEGRSSQASMLKQPFVKQSHLQPVINYFNEQAPEKATTSKLSQRSVADAKRSSSGQSNWLHWLWKTLITIDTDPQITQRFDQSGQLYWQAYDPITDRRFTFLTKNEVYQWLEARYYQ